MVPFTWRWQPHFRFIKQLVEDGYVGRCFYADLYMLLGFGLEPVYRWRADGHRTNGVISDLGAHLIDFARWYVGKSARVNALLGTFVEIAGLDDRPIQPTNDTAAVLLQFENGAQGVIRTSSVAHRGERGGEKGLKLCGEAGTLEAEQIYYGPTAGARIQGIRSGQESFREIEIPGAYFENMPEKGLFEPYYTQPVGPRLFVDAILEDRSVEPNFYDGLQVQEVIDSIMASSRTGTWVDVP